MGIIEADDGCDHRAETYTQAADEGALNRKIEISEEAHKTEDLFKGMCGFLFGAGSVLLEIVMAQVILLLFSSGAERRSPLTPARGRGFDCGLRL